MEGSPMLQVDMWELVGAATALLSTFIGAVLFISRALVVQFDRRLEEKFSSLTKVHESEERRWLAEFTQLHESQRRIERELLEHKAEIAREYLRREDSIRDMTLVHAKLDALATRIEMSLQLVSSLEGRMTSHIREGK